MSIQAVTALPHAIETALRAIYEEVERRGPQRRCQLQAGCCHFRLTGRQPQVTLAEALLAAKGVRASGRTRIQPRRDGACALLGKDGRCTIYPERPFGCRTHFCDAAGGPYPRKRVADLIQQLESIDEQIGWHGGSRKFEPALVDAMAMLK